MESYQEIGGRGIHRQQSYDQLYPHDQPIFALLLPKARDKLQMHPWLMFVDDEFVDQGIEGVFEGVNVTILKRVNSSDCWFVQVIAGE